MSSVVGKRPLQHWTGAALSGWGWEVTGTSGRAGARGWWEMVSRVWDNQGDVTSPVSPAVGVPGSKWKEMMSVQEGKGR